MIDQLPVMPRFRIKTTKQTFNTLQEAALNIGNVTINRNYELFFKNIPQHIKNRYNILAREFKNKLTVIRDSLFNEIEVFSEPVPPSMRFLFARYINKRRIDINLLAQNLVDRMSKFIESSWDSNKTHVMPHSSGYDSRLISTIIRRLTQKNGREWLGDIYFICWEPEVRDFMTVMQYEGWDKNHIILIKGPATDFYRQAVSFFNLGKYCSDSNRFICYCFDYLIYKKIENLNLNNVQIVSGLFSDEILRKEATTPRADMIWNDLSHFMVHFLHDVHFEWSSFDVLLPFMSLNVIDYLFDYNLPRADDLKLAMLNYLDPNLAQLPNYRFEYFKIIRKQGSHPYYRLSDATVANMSRALKNSWYFGVLNPSINISNILVNDSKILKDYTNAAICEYLIQKGVNINA